MSAYHNKSPKWDAQIKYSFITYRSTFSEYTLVGPPDRIMALGFKLSIFKGGIKRQHLTVNIHL